MIRIGLGTDDFYMNGDLMEESGDTAQNNVVCEVPEAWYEANKDSLPAHYKMINDGDDVKIINCKY